MNQPLVPAPADDLPDVIENVTFDELLIGQSAQLTRTLAMSDVLSFAAVSGDINPAHMDPVYAADTPMRTIVAHGMWTGTLFSAVFGNQLPGLGTIYLEQNLRFRRPVRVGDTITVQVEVRAKDEEKKHVEFDCTVNNQHGETVVLGTARVLAPTRKLRHERMKLPKFRLLEAPLVSEAPEPVAA
jgi:phosphate acetyltransferase